MKIRVETDSERKNRRESWHGWFAWFPVFAYDVPEKGSKQRKYLVWFQRVQRRRVYPIHRPARWWYRV